MRCKIPSRDLALKLNDTVCRYKKQPVWVKINDGRVLLYRLDDIMGKYTQIKSNDPEFDVASVPLGYVNGEGERQHRTYYLSRVPIRKVKQGLPINAINTRQVGSTEDIRPRGGFAQGIVFTKSFIDMVTGQYPVIPDTISKLRNLFSKDGSKIYQAAINKNIAMEINQMGVINVHYKGKFVGWIQPDKMIIHVPKSDISWVVSKYLSEHLDWVVD